MPLPTLPTSVFVYLLSVTGLKQDRSVYREDWGEALTNKSVPVICAVNLQCGSVSVLQGVPPDVSPGQVRKERLQEEQSFRLFACIKAVCRVIDLTD